MEKSTTARNSRTCTADLLNWSSEIPPPSSSASRSRHPFNGIGKVLFRGDVSDEEAESLYKRRPSGYKVKEMNGSNIFSAGGKDVASESGPVNGDANIRTSVRIVQPSGGQSSILFGGEPVVKPVKKIHSQKAAELNGHGIFKGDTVTPPGSSEKSLSRSKLREMSGSGIFSDGKAESRVCYGGIRKPPGGESSIRLF